jgi:poly(ADP-ribose) glycohydrolase ARH3
MERAQLQTKFRGALLGVAVGDALGAPFEGTRFMPRGALDRLVQDPGSMRYTDDTHMTLGLAASLLAQQGFNGHHMAMTFAQNFAAEPWRGYGFGPPQVFHRLSQGVSWDEAGEALFDGQVHLAGIEGAVLQACAVALLLGREPHTPFDRRAFIMTLHDHVHTRVFRDALLAIATRARGDRGAGGDQTAGPCH